MQNNILLIDNLEYINIAKEVGINTFLFPFKGYSLGFDNYFTLEEIKEENSYLYINKNLDNFDIDSLKEIFANLSSNIKGVFFEDLGLIPVLENTNLEKIIFAHHLTTNFSSINNLLEFVNSVVISTDITKKEMQEILDKTNKPLGIFSFGLIPIMYSRRTLLTNYQKFYNLENRNNEIITEKITNTPLKFVENEFGTIAYLNKFYNNLSLKHNNISFNLINTYGLDKDNFIELLNSIKLSLTPQFKNINITEGFLNEKTYFKLPPKEAK